MMLIDLKLSEFIDELASEKPAPGGGSAAALAGALSAALASMVCRLTIGKKKYKDVEDEMKLILKETENLRETLAKLIDEDTESFKMVSKAYSMPRDNEAQAAARRDAIQSALKGAIDVPLEVINTCKKVLDLLHTIVQSGNVNAISDAAVSALLADACIKGAAYNVRINANSLEDNIERKRLTEITDEAICNSSKMLAEILKIADSRLKLLIR
jgi:formiminotetrahydrofolate cyclodeaminase